MKVGIIEIMPKGHYTLVDSIVQIYSSDSQNEIYIFTHTSGFNVLKPIVEKLKNKPVIICKNDNESVTAFIKRINNFTFEKLYIVTLEKYFTKIFLLKHNSPLFLFIHNIEDWFLLSFNVLMYRFIVNVLRSKLLIFNFKVSFIYPFFKRKIKKEVLDSGGKFVVLNKILKAELAVYVKNEKIEVIPFSVYDPTLKNISANNNFLRVCIPGILDNTRRNYFSVFDCIEKNIDFFKDSLVLDLLGSVSDVSYKIIKEADRLKQKGLKIIPYPTQYIPISEFEENLSKADIILGNLNTTLNKYCIYGKTKDTGAIFAMIRAGKPGILPHDYALIDELKSSTLTYKTYDDLAGILKNLITNRDLLQHLSSEAVKNSQYFEPMNILKSL